MWLFRLVVVHAVGLLAAYGASLRNETSLLDYAFDSVPFNETRMNDDVIYDIVSDVTAEADFEPFTNATDFPVPSTPQPPKRPDGRNSIITWLACGLALSISVTTLLYYAFPSLFKCIK